MLSRRCFVGLLLASASCRSAEVAPEGDYLIRILFVRHSFSCAIVQWNHCTFNVTQLGMGVAAYNDAIERWKSLLRTKQVGININDLPTPRQGKHVNRTSDDCLMDDYNKFWNLVAINELVRDPHLTACGQHGASTAADVLSKWLEVEQIKFDLVGSSFLKRAIETAELVYMTNPSKVASRVAKIMPLPYLNEKSSIKTFSSLSNYPYPVEIQENQIRNLFGLNFTPLDSAFDTFPREDQMWDKFKVVLALNILPSLISGSAISGDPELLAELEMRGPDGNRLFPEQSNWPQIVDNPIERVGLGNKEYVWKAPFQEATYSQLKENAAKEFVIGIGSHAEFLMAHCWQGKDKPHNLAVLEKLLRVSVATSNGKTSFVVSEGAEPCRLIMDGPLEPQPGSVTKSDLGAICFTPFDVSRFLELTPEPRIGETSTCMSSGGVEAFKLPIELPSRNISDMFSVLTMGIGEVTRMAAIGLGVLSCAFVASMRPLMRRPQEAIPLLEGDFGH